MNSFTKILNELKKFETYSGYDMTDIKNLLEENIREEAIKKSKTKKSELSIIKSVFKDKGTMDIFKNKTWLTKGFFTYLSAHRVLFSKNDLGFEKTEDAVYNCEELFEQHTKCKLTEVNIDMNNLKAFIDTHTKKENKPYIIEIKKGNKKKFIGVNAWYLMDCLKFVNNNTLYINSPKTPLYTKEFKDGELNKMTICLPIYCKPYGELIANEVFEF